jgi:hypothetical protein
MPRNVPDPPDARGSRGQDPLDLPRATLRFKLRAWREFQHALDPLGPTKPLPSGPPPH